MLVDFKVKTSEMSGLKACPINPAWIRDGNPMARASMMFSSADGWFYTIIWDCSPGKFEWFYDQDETLHLLSGYMILDEGLPTERHVRPGDNVFFPAGSSAHWYVIEHVVKVANVRRPIPGPLIHILNLFRFIRNRGRRSSGMFGQLDTAVSAARESRKCETDVKPSYQL